MQYFSKHSYGDVKEKRITDRGVGRIPHIPCDGGLSCFGDIYKGMEWGEGVVVVYVAPYCVSRDIRDYG